MFMNISYSGSINKDGSAITSNGLVKYSLKNRRWWLSLGGGTPQFIFLVTTDASNGYCHGGSIAKSHTFVENKKKYNIFMPKYYFRS